MSLTGSPSQLASCHVFQWATCLPREEQMAHYNRRFQPRQIHNLLPVELVIWYYTFVLLFCQPCSNEILLATIMVLVARHHHRIQAKAQFVTPARRIMH